MPELWLNFVDENGQKPRVAVSTDRFVIGRQPGNDLTIADSRLSRHHAYIRKFGDRFEIADKGSSNGTDLNGEPVFDPVTIRNGDVLSFGGVEVRVEIVSSVAAAVPAAEPTPVPALSKAPSKVKVDSAEPEEARSIGLGLILLAPILAAVLIVLAGGVVYIMVSQASRDVTANELDTDDPVIEEDDGPKNTRPGDDDTKPTPKPADSNSGPVNGGPTPTPANLSETAKVEINGASFMRKIAQNDPKAFLTSEQAKRVGGKVKQLSGSSGVMENINSARKNAGQIKTLAASKNMKPEFLAVAAITKLGSNKGDVMASAQSIADVLDKLSTHLGNELADDCLLTIAAFDQGAAGETMKMRNMLQDLANKTNESSRAIRTIWFLQKQGKISAAEFERALTFLAIGTITQNPKDFAVNTEALVF